MTNLIQGAGGGGGKGGGKAYKPKTAKDTLESTQYAQVLDLLSEGEIEGLKDGNKSIFLNNTPLQNADGSYNFENVTVFVRRGRQDQRFIPLNNAIEDERAVGVEVLQGTPVVRTITDPNVDAVRITITFPQIQEFTDKGDILGSSVQLQIAVQYNGGGFTTVIDDVVSGRSGDQYQRDYVVNLDGTLPAEIKVTRLTADSTNVKLVNSFSWTSYTELVYAKLRYPNSAIVAMRVDAEQFSSIPTRSYLIRGIKVKIPNNATVDSTNGRLTYSGVWNGTFGAAQWCSDPAWILWDLLTSKRYGFGDFLQEATLDKWAFYSASQYCSALVPDGFGGQEPRFSCNVNIQTAEEAYKLINDMCSVFRGMPYWSTGALTVAQDRPTDRTYLFTLANVSEEGFSYQASSQKTRPTVALVSYLDLETRDIAYETVEDQAALAKYGAVTTQISAFACTSRGQASRIGEWLLYSEQYENEVISFTTSVDAGVLVRPGQTIEVSDPVRAGQRRGGRIRAATSTTITVDSTTDLPASGGSISILLPDGTADIRDVVSRSGSVITVTPAFSAVPNVNTVWIYRTPDLQSSLWRVLSVQEQDGAQYTITALSYNASKYDYIERGRPLKQRDVTNLNVIPAAPTGLVLSEALYRYQDQVRAKVIASWRSVTGVSQYEVRWRKDKGNWTVLRKPGPDFELLDITPGLFEFQIYSTNASLKLSTTALTGSITALGKTAPPADVTGFTATLDPDIGVTLTWNPVADLDLQGYEIWQGTAFGAGTKIGLFNATSKKLGLVPSGNTSWYIKALDTSGVYSQNASGVTIDINGAVAPINGGIFSGENFVFSWNKVTGDLATDSYEIRFGSTTSTWSTATVLATTKGTTYTVKATWSGTRRFFVAAVDIKGNVGAASFFDAIVTVPTQPSLTQQVIDNNVLLKWNDCKQTLPVDSYELRRGATFATATPIGTKKGLFTSVFETVGGTYTYWLAGIDSAGNYGAAGSVVAVVNQPPDYVLDYNQASTFSGTKVNTMMEGGKLFATVNTTETWQSHFTSRGWNTPQDQINAGFTFYGLPSTTSGSYTEEIDFGALLAGTKITATLNSTNVVGSVTVTPTLSVKATAGAAWTDYAGISTLYATNFRYLKIAYNFSSAGGNDLLRIDTLQVTLEKKLKTDSGSGTANAADTGGTTVTFNVAFVDIESISVTASGTAARIAVYDFVDAPNPTSFKVLLFDTSGTRVSGGFSWQVKGS